MLRLIPGWQQAEFVRLGQMHRNTFINSPTLLQPTLQFAPRRSLLCRADHRHRGLCGQHHGRAGGGHQHGAPAAADEPLLTLPRTTMMGALLHYITHAEPANFQPMKAAMGLLPELDDPVRNKRPRYATYAERARPTWRRIWRKYVS